MVFDFLKRLAGGAAGQAKVEPVEHEGFLIFAEPGREGGQWQVKGRIEKEIDGEVKEHVFIRADMLHSQEDARQHTLLKARRLIDEQGERLFR